MNRLSYRAALRPPFRFRSMGPMRAKNRMEAFHEPTCSGGSRLRVRRASRSMTVHAARRSPNSQPRRLRYAVPVKVPMHGKKTVKAFYEHE